MHVRTCAMHAYRIRIYTHLLTCSVGDDLYPVYVTTTTTRREGRREGVRVMSSVNLKQFLYTFCGKSQVQPAYTFESEEGGFYCEVGEIA